MQDDDTFFADNPKQLYRVRAATPSEVPGADPEQALLVGKINGGKYMRAPLDLDLSDAVNQNPETLAADTPFAISHKTKQRVSFDDFCEHCRKADRQKARARAMK